MLYNAKTLCVNLRILRYEKRWKHDSVPDPTSAEQCKIIWDQLRVLIVYRTSVRIKGSNPTQSLRTNM